jgi:hypothetical protein
MSRPSKAAKSAESEMSLVFEVDGNPVGVLHLDLNRIWPLINHRKRDTAPPTGSTEPDSALRFAPPSREISPRACRNSCIPPWEKKLFRLS